MNRDAFDGHPLWVTVSSLGETAGSDLTVGDVDQDDIDFIHAAVQYLQARRGVDPGLIETQTLDTIENSASTALTALTSYKADPETQSGVIAAQVRPHLKNAIDQARNTMPAPAAAGETHAAQDALNRYKDAAQEEIENLRDTIGELRERLAEIEAEREQQASTAQQGLTTLEERIQQNESNVATQTATLQEQIETQRASFTDEAQKRTAASDKALEAQEEKAKESREGQAEEAKVLIADLEKKRTQAQQLLDAVNNDVISGDYKGWSNKQAKAANVWTGTTVVLGVATVIALVVVILNAKGDTPQFLISKTAVGIIGLIVAGYAARQAAEHRHEERTANRLALDLAALEPYLEHVSKPEELRTEIARRVFAPQPSKTETPRFNFGRRAMTMADLIEFAKILRGTNGPTPPT